MNPPVPRGSAQAEATVRRFGAHRKCVGSTAASAVSADQQLIQRGETQRPQQRHAGLGPGTSLVSASFAKTHTSADESIDLANARVLISTWAAYPNPTASSSRTPIGRRIRGLPLGQWRAPRVPVDSQRKGMLHAHARGQWLGECLWRIAGQSSLDILSPGHQHVWPKPPLDVR